MIYKTLSTIEGSPTDYKVCNSCKCLNWYENTECHHCEENNFGTTEEDVTKWVKEEKEDYEDEGYPEICLTLVEVQVS